MGLLSRRKGCAFERLVAVKLRQALPGRTVRRSVQADRAYEPDVVIEGSGVWLELQDARKPDPEAKLEQAERDAARVNGLPIVVWHRIRERKIHASMRLSTLLKLSGVDTVWPSTGPIVHVSFGWVLERLAAMEAA